MSSDSVLKWKDRGERRRKALENALENGLPDAIEATGMMFLGFTARYDVDNCLIVLKAQAGSKQQVAFVGSDSLVNCLLKCVRDAQNDRLRWQPDKYAKK